MGDAARGEAVEPGLDEGFHPVGEGPAAGFETGGHVTHSLKDHSDQLQRGKTDWRV